LTIWHYKRIEMHVKDAITTKQNVTLWANWRSRRSRYKRIQLYRTDLYKVSSPIRIKLKSYFQGKLFIFRANCYFPGQNFSAPPIICLPVRLCHYASTVLKSYSYEISYHKFLLNIMKLSFPVSTFNAHTYFCAISEKLSHENMQKIPRTTQNLFNKWGKSKPSCQKAVIFLMESCSALSLVLHSDSNHIQKSTSRDFRLRLWIKKNLARLWW